MIKKLLSEQAKKTAKEYTVKPEKSEDCCPDLDSPEQPYIHLDSKTLPEIAEWEVDGEYVIMLKVKQMSKSMYTDRKTKKEVYDGRFDILEVATVKDNPKPKSKGNSVLNKAYKV